MEKGALWGSFFCQMLAYMKKKQYLCAAKVWAFEKTNGKQIK